MKKIPMLKKLLMSSLQKNLQKTLIESAVSTAVFAGSDRFVFNRSFDVKRVAEHGASSLVSDSVFNLTKQYVPSNFAEVFENVGNPVITASLFTLLHNFVMPRLGQGEARSSLMYSFLQSLGSQGTAVYVADMIPKQ